MRAVLVILSIVFFGFLFLVSLGLSLLGRVLHFFGFSPFRSQFFRTGTSAYGPSAATSASSASAKDEPSKKKFPDSEGEYIDFEEV